MATRPYRSISRHELLASASDRDLSQASWLRWFADHDIDPADVLDNSPILCDDEQCTITYQGYEHDPDQPPWHDRVVKQLGSPALPMPGELEWLAKEKAYQAARLGGPR